MKVGDVRETKKRSFVKTFVWRIIAILNSFTVLTLNMTDEPLKNALIMIENKTKGIIIMISSIAGLVSLKKRASYSSSKGGLISLTKSIATDYADKNIRSFCICPAYIETELTKPYLQKLSKKEYQDLISLHKLKKIGKPEHISHMISFLLEEKNSWMTGNIIAVDGGYTV